jgi:hypothetical protein
MSRKSDYSLTTEYTENTEEFPDTRLEENLLLFRAVLASFRACRAFRGYPRFAFANRHED